MGLLVDGVWRDQWYDTAETAGRFVRSEFAISDRITADGSSRFPTESGRYHLYVAMACPWAHRALIFRAIKGLTEMVSVSVVEPLMLENGWELVAAADPVNSASFLYEVYRKVDPDYSGRVTVPVLWDRWENTIVNNELADIIRIFNSAFDGLGAAPGDYCPEALREQIDAVNARVYEKVNNGVYQAGFATTQAAYEEAYFALFDELASLDDRLGRQRYLVGDRITEADWRLFPTLARFDAVYYGHFKCNQRRLVDFPNLWAYTRDLFQRPGVAGTLDLDQVKTHYFGSHRTINPTGIVPAGPEIDFTAPHGRDRDFGGAG